jgi:hypothetical protein
MTTGRHQKRISIKVVMTLGRDKKRICIEVVMTMLTETRKGYALRLS